MTTSRFALLLAALALAKISAAGGTRSSAAPGQAPEGAAAVPEIGSEGLRNSLQAISETAQRQAGFSGVSGGEAEARALGDQAFSNARENGGSPVSSAEAAQSADYAREWGWRGAVAGQPWEGQFEQGHRVWATEIWPLLEGRGDQLKTNELFKAYLHAGDYAALGRFLGITRKTIKGETSAVRKGLAFFGLAKSPVSAVDRLAALMRFERGPIPNAEAADKASAPESFASDAAYFRWIEEQVNRGVLSGYYARVMIGSRPDYSRNPRAAETAMRLPSSFSP